VFHVLQDYQNTILYQLLEPCKSWNNVIGCIKQYWY